METGRNRICGFAESHRRNAWLQDPKTSSRKTWDALCSEIYYNQEQDTRNRRREGMNRIKTKYAEKNKIYTAYCVKFMRDRIKPGSVDLTVTSPPYDNLRNYEGYVFDFENTAKSLYEVTRGGGGS